MHGTFQICRACASLDEQPLQRAPAAVLEGLDEGSTGASGSAHMMETQK
jgi:hypothetical protein